MVYANVLFILWLAHQQPLGVGQEGPVDEPQADVVAEDANLADAGAHRATPLLVIIAESAAMLALGGLWSHAGDNVPDLQDDIPELRRYVLKMFFYEPSR